MTTRKIRRARKADMMLPAFPMAISIRDTATTMRSNMFHLSAEYSEIPSPIIFRKASTAKTMVRDRLTVSRTSLYVADISAYSMESTTVLAKMRKKIVGENQRFSTMARKMPERLMPSWSPPSPANICFSDSATARLYFFFISFFSCSSSTTCCSSACLSASSSAMSA